MADKIKVSVFYGTATDQKLIDTLCDKMRDSEDFELVGSFLSQFLGADCYISRSIDWTIDFEKGKRLWLDEPQNSGEAYKRSLYGEFNGERK